MLTRRALLAMGCICMCDEKVELLRACMLAVSSPDRGPCADQQPHH